jgi:hypothetical protein
MALCYCQSPTHSAELARECCSRKAESTYLQGCPCKQCIGLRGCYSAHYPKLKLLLLQRSGRGTLQTSPNPQPRAPSKMPFSDVFIAALPGACGPECQNEPSLSRLSVGFRGLQLRYYCDLCRRSTDRYFSLASGCFEEHPPDGEHFKRLRQFPCSSGCEYLPFLTVVEVGLRFLRLQFECGQCLQRFSRYFDIEADGYVLLPKPLGRLSNRPGWGLFRGQARYCEDSCVFYTEPSDWPATPSPRTRNFRKA